MNLSTVFVLIPVYNRRSTTLACLEHLQTIGLLSACRVVVMDDGSTDGTAEAIQVNYPTVEILAGTGDWWWTGAIHHGMAYAMAQGADWLVWLNDDCWPDATTIPALIEFLQYHPGTIVAPACYFPGSPTPAVSGFRGRQRMAANPDQVISAEGTSGYCVAMPRSLVEQIGLPDAQRFPHYGGDGIYLLQARRSGYAIYLLGHAKVTLVGEASPVHEFLAYTQSLNAPTWQRLFWYRKSPYRLLTQFHYHQVKYGKTIGLMLFLVKALAWNGQWAMARLTTSFVKHSRCESSEN